MSDLDAYRSLYVAESRENLEGIVSNLLVLEKGTDSHAIDEIFRSAHSLKGMSASMGFMHMEEICHALEDVFSQIRSGKLEVTQSLVDDLLAGADDIELMIDEIEEGGEGQLEHKDQRVKSLKRWLAVADGGTKETRPDPEPTPLIQYEPDSDQSGDMYEGPSYDQDAGAGCQSYEISLSLADNVDNKNLRGMLILQNLESIGEIIQTGPVRSVIEDDENFSGAITLQFRTNAGIGAIETILGVSDVQSRTINVAQHPIGESVIPEKDDIEDLSPVEVISDGEEQYTIHIEISSSVDSKNLRSMLLLQNIEGLGKISQITPKRTIIEDSDSFNGIIDLLFITNEPKEKILSLLKGSDIKNYSVQKEEPVITPVSGISVESSDDLTPTGPRTSTPDKTEKKREVKNIRVDIDRLDHMMNLVEDLVINRGRLEQIAQQYKIKELDETLNMVGRSVSDLQVMMMDIRMIPLNHIFNRFPRTVRDIATKEGKEVDFVVEGGDTELDRSVMDGLNDPLLHLIRNALDHGIESPDVRITNGKNPKGLLKLSASRDKDNVVIVIEDDGGGVNVEKIKKKALERGLVTEESLALMSDQEAYDLLFQPGFSTADKITDISGRGVGLDVVRTTIASLQGTIKLESVPGEGSRFELVLPPTMAIVMVMMIRINGKRCAIPITNVAEVASLAAFPIQNIGNGEGLLMRDEIIVLYRLDDMFGRSKTEEVIVVLQNGPKKGAIIADLIEGQQEVVIKPLSKFVGTCEGVSGVTIPGDGEVVPVLDVKAILREGGQKSAKKAGGRRGKKMVKNVVTDGDLVISEQQADELRELGNIGAAHAATTLSTILSTMIQIRVPEIILVNLANLRNYLDDVRAALTVFQIQGQISGEGYLILHIPEDSIIRLTNIMIGTTELNREIDDMDKSAINEIGNIMTSSFLDACATLLNIIMIPSPPSMVIDMPHAALESIIATQEIRENVDEVVLFRTELTCATHEIKANIILLPSRSLLQEIFARMENVIAISG
ncbi:Hpt domain-containing protein [Methanospirillum purgamenti]|nr:MULTISPECIES: Hpt domain-containing protein [Methanospirillum]MDX8550662.1 Hpt domain-containing protein [Methanospirillum hungatei]